MACIKIVSNSHTLVLSFYRALERERSVTSHLQQSLEMEKSNTERNTYRDQSALEDIQIQLETEKANLDDLNRALVREQKAREEAESEKSLLKDHLNQERALNEDLKHDVDKLQVKLNIKCLLPTMA